MPETYEANQFVAIIGTALEQVEYAMESVSHAGCVIGILAPGDAGTHLGKELSTVRLYCCLDEEVLQYLLMSL